MIPDWMFWVMLVVQILTLITVLLIHDGVKFIWRAVDGMVKTVTSVQKSVSTTQSELRTRMKSDGVEPIMDKPKAKQHYEGRGIRRVARGGKEDEAGGESPPARISSVKRRSYGGTSGDSFSS
jgi:hypothetical protein